MLRLYISVFIFTIFSVQSFSKSLTKKEIISIIDKVNTNWQNSHPNPGNSFWDNAAYHTGNMEVYKITGNEQYRAYSEKWAQQNNWRGATSDNKARWKYKYGEKPSTHFLTLIIFHFLTSIF